MLKIIDFIVIFDQAALALYTKVRVLHTYNKIAHRGGELLLESRLTNISVFFLEGN